VLIALDTPHTPDVLELIGRHLAENYATSPPESVHALGADALTHPSISFWSAREEVSGQLLGIGALKRHSPEMAELKSMRTTEAARRRGVASALLRAIIKDCRRAGVRELNLETGAEDYFAPARALYERTGFEACPPFAAYTTDPNSVYLSLRIAPDGAR